MCKDGGPWGRRSRTPRPCRAWPWWPSCPLDQQLVERVDIGARRGHKRVGIGALADHRLAVLRETDRDLGLGVGAFGHRMDLIDAAASRRAGRAPMYGVEGRVDRAVARDLGGLLRGAVDLELQSRGLRPMRAGDHLQRDKLDVFVVSQFRISSSISATISSSKTSFLRSARSLKRLNASFIALSPISKPNSLSLALNAWRSPNACP